MGRHPGATDRACGTALFVVSGGRAHHGALSEFSALVDVLPEGTVLDGELLAYKDDILPFQKLQTRIGRKKVGKKLLAEAPCVLRLYDLLEWKGKDLRSEPLEKDGSCWNNWWPSIGTPCSN